MFEISISDGDIDDVISTLNNIHADQPPLVLDAARRATIKDFHDIQACPGSGKTTLVGLKLLCLIQKWQDTFRGICVLTHTNVARDEILKRIRQHPAGQKLQNYPHFIGTIQEFVNTFLALPACRSESASVARVDDAYCEERLSRMIQHKTRTFLEKNLKSVADLRYVWHDNAMVLNVPGFAKVSNSDSYKDLVDAKAKLIASGAYFYSEMYALGRKLMAENPHLLEILRHRFPVVIIDEMQDAQKFQDDLISLIFDGGHVQRLGDPDQSIFDGLGNEEPNSSYNNAALLPIAESHRFVPNIAVHITGLSHRKLTLTTSYAPLPNGPMNTVILYDGTTLPQVLEKFATIVGMLDPEHRKVVKAVGGISENQPGAADPLNIRSYWAEFDRTRHVKSFTPSSLCQAVAYCAACLKGDVYRYHQILLQAIADVLRHSGVRVRGRGGRDYPPSRLNLAVHLHERSTAHRFRLLCAAWIMGVPPTAETWAVQILELADILGVSVTSTAVKNLLSFDPLPPPIHAEETDTGNCFVGTNGIKVQLSTIHSVKGETHDATLLLETKFQKLFDVKEMIPFILNPTLATPVFDPAHPKTNESIRSSFMKKLYVAASRPRHLLCLAMGKSRLTAGRTLKDQKYVVYVFLHDDLTYSGQFLCIDNLPMAIVQSLYLGCRSLKYKIYPHTFANDDTAVQFLRERVDEDFKLATAFSLSDSFTLPEYYSHIRAGHGLLLYDSLFIALNASPTPLCVTTLVENGKIRITDSSYHGDPNIYLTEKALEGRKMDDWLLKYTTEQGLDLPRLVHDDYFLAIKMTFNAKHYVSAMKLLLSCIDSISYIEYGDGRRTPFIDWLNAYADLSPLRITAEELWEMRNGMLHMTNLHSRKVRNNQVRRISFRVGGTEGSEVDGIYYFQFHGLIQAYGAALGRWFESYNKDRTKFVKFIERYDETISDSRFAS